MEHRGGTDKVLKKLEISLENGDYYSAHQMYLTICNRYIKQKKIDEAVKLLSSGAKLLCLHKQYGSALELSRMLIDAWSQNYDVVAGDAELKKHEKDYITGEQLDLFFELLETFPTSEEGTFDLIKVGIKWTSQYGGNTDAEALMHHQCGILYYNDQKYEEAHRHFLHGTVDSALSLATLCSAQGKKALELKKISNVESMANMAFDPVLRYLATKKIANAIAFFNSFTASLQELDENVKATSISTAAHPSGKLVLYKMSLLNFIQLIILSVQRGPKAAGLFKLIRQNYGSGGTGEGGIEKQLLDQIGKEYFNIQPVRQGGNPLQDLMKNLFSGGETEEEGSGSENNQQKKIEEMD